MEMWEAGLWIALPSLIALFVLAGILLVSWMRRHR